MMRKLSHIVGLACVLLTIGGCSRPGEDKIARTKSNCTPSSVRSALLPLFADYHYDASAPDWGPPNYRALSPVPSSVSSLPLFSSLAPGQEVLMGALKEDTNALIVFTQSGMDKWGVVVHRDSSKTDPPSMGGQTFSFWSNGVFFYLGSTMP